LYLVPRQRLRGTDEVIDVVSGCPLGMARKEDPKQMRLAFVSENRMQLISPEPAGDHPDCSRKIVDSR
jgi:hypothetical protein